VKVVHSHGVFLRSSARLLVVGGIVKPGRVEASYPGHHLTGIRFEFNCNGNSIGLG